MSPCPGCGVSPGERHDRNCPEYREALAHQERVLDHFREPAAGRPQPVKTKHRAPIHLSDGEVTAIMGRMLQLAHRGKISREEREELKRLRKDINLIHKRLMEYHRLIDAVLSAANVWTVDAMVDGRLGKRFEGYTVARSAFEALQDYRQS